ncbi:MAG: gephyrin-like molybdotransferase Glp [bacterium]
MVDINNEAMITYESVESALKKYMKEIEGKTLGYEEINIEDSLGRILYDDVIAQYDLPAFSRALIDGYAVNSHDVILADSQNPVTLKIIAEAQVGYVDELIISEKEAVKISTGAMLPKNADSIVMLENTISEGNQVKVFKSVIVGENIAQKGEDISIGELFIRKKRKIRAQDIGGIICLGFRKIRVFKMPAVAVIPTGNELIPINVTPKLGQLPESNTYVLKGLVEQLGGISKIQPIVKDNPDMVRESICKALESSDIILISGGSSIGSKDYTLEAIKSIKNSKIIAHGIAMRPGKQTLLAFIDGKLVIGLPGHPVSCITSFLVFVKPVLIQLAGNPRSFWQERKDNIKIDAILAKDVESPKDREDYVRVRLKLLDNGKITAYPYAGKSSFISTLVKSHGLIKLAPDCSKLYEGDRVKVILF